MGTTRDPHGGRVWQAHPDRGEETRTRLLVGALVAIAAIALADYDRPLRGSDYERATAAALEHVGKGTVTETEVGDFGAANEVEIRLDDGRQVEVTFDKNFAVIGREADDDGPDDVDEGRDDD